MVKLISFNFIIVISAIVTIWSKVYRLDQEYVRRTDGKAGGRLELRDRNNKNNDKVDGRRNIQVHVGGTYTNSEERRGVGGSLGCSTLSGADKGNKGRDRFVSDITERVKNNSEANKSNIILI